MANTNPIFTGLITLGRFRIAVANTARDGSGTINALLRDDGSTLQGSRVFYSCTADAGTDRLTVTIPDLTYYPLAIKNGMPFEFVSGTPPTGTSLNVKYVVANMVVASTTSITFQVMSRSTNAILDLTSTGTAPVIGVDTGTRIDRITWTSAQATAAASSGMVGRVFISDNAGSNYRLRAEVAITTVTASNTVIGATQQIVFTGGLLIPSGCQIGVTQSIYASAADQMDVIAEGGEYIAI